MEIVVRRVMLPWVWSRKPALDLSRLTADEKLELIDDLWRSLSSDDLP
ncbi:hypothetical protein [Sorangium sp. So ce1097]